MKKLNLKIIFSTVGVLTTATAMGGGVLVSCGTTINPKHDLPTTADAAFTSKKLTPIIKEALNNKLNNSDSDIKNLTFKISKIIKRNHDIAKTTIDGSFNASEIKYNFTQKINYDFNLNSYIVVNTTLMTKNSNTTDNPATAIFTDKLLRPIITAGLIKKLATPTANIQTLSFEIGTIIDNDKNIPQTNITGSFNCDDVKYSFKQTISYDGKNYIVKATSLTMPASIPTNAFVPFDDSYVVKTDSSSSWRVYNNVALHDVLIKPFVDIHGDFLFDFKLVSKITWNETNHTAAATLTGHGNKDHHWSKVPFTANVTCDYSTKKYTITKFSYSQSYADALDNKKIAKPITHRIAQLLGSTDDKVKNLKFSTKDINDTINNEPSIDVAGIYSYKAFDFSTRVKKFKMTITYKYSNKSYVASKFESGMRISDLFAINHPDYSKTYSNIMTALAAKKYHNISNLAQNGPITFSKNDYFTNVISANFTGVANKNPEDASPANFSITINYDLTTKKYSYDNLNIKVKFADKLTHKAMVMWVARSLQQMPGSGSGKYNEWAINFSLDSVKADPQDDNKITVHISGRTSETPIGKNDTRYIKNFNFDVTYDNSKKDLPKLQQYSISNFKTDNKIILDVFSKANMNQAMTKIITADPKNKGKTISDLTVMQKPGQTSLALHSFGTRSQIMGSYKLDGVKKSISGILVCNFNTFEYTYKTL